MERLTDEREQQIRARLAAATKGPWRMMHRCAGAGPDDDEIAGLGWDWDDSKGTAPPQPLLRGVFARAADARFIENAHEDIRLLLREVTVLRAERDAAKANAEQLQKACEALLNRLRTPEEEYAIEALEAALRKMKGVDPP